jgi:hypothetical protein
MFAFPFLLNLGKALDLLQLRLRVVVLDNGLGRDTLADKVEAFCGDHESAGEIGRTV